VEAFAASGRDGDSNGRRVADAGAHLTGIADISGIAAISGSAAAADVHGAANISGTAAITGISATADIHGTADIHADRTSAQPRTLLAAATAAHAIHRSRIGGGLMIDVADVHHFPVRASMSLAVNGRTELISFQERITPFGRGALVDGAGDRGGIGRVHHFPRFGIVPVGHGGTVAT
jgi:hypothetical protein